MVASQFSTEPQETYFPAESIKNGFVIDAAALSSEGHRHMPLEMHYMYSPLSFQMFFSVIH